MLWHCWLLCAYALGCFYIVSQFSASYEFIGNLLFRVLGVILYVVDVVTDIVSGVDLISGTEINRTVFAKNDNENYTKDVCNHLLDHSHPIWGSLNIGFAWFPVLMAIPNLIFHWHVYHKRSPINWSMQLFTLIIMVVFWPLIGLFL